ncbi:MAG: AraC family transcriptional regulator [Spirochaetaceae bacterium]|nr:AraC family transcriptional regulator [Spirochaetaceae bacterium]
MSGLYRPRQPAMGCASQAVDYREYPPGGELAGLVHCYWSFSSPRGPVDFTYRAFPDLCADLYFDFSRFQYLKLLGIATRTIVAPMLPGSDFFGIRFAPGAIGRFFRLPLSEFQDRSPSFSDLGGNAAAELEGRLAEARSTAARVAVAEAWLLARAEKGLFERDERFSKALGNIYLHGGTKPVALLAEDAGLSVRQFSRLFLAGQGLQPKAFSRIVRFQRALDLVLRHPELAGSWAAQEAGYYDQPHFLREFREICGELPSNVRNVQDFSRARGDTAPQDARYRGPHISRARRSGWTQARS